VSGTGNQQGHDDEGKEGRGHREQRFALFKLTRPNHDNDNFIPAMREFGLLD
jgi:hypothetical protein